MKTFGNEYLCRIMDYCWTDSVLNRQLLCENALRPTAYVLCYRLLRHYWLLPCYPEIDVARHVVFEENNLGWRRQMECP